MDAPAPEPTAQHGRILRTNFVVLFLKGTGLGATLPFFAVWLTEDLHATLFQVGLARTLGGVVAVAASFLIAAIVDRTSKRRRFILATLAVECCAWLILAKVRSLGLAVVVASIGNLASVPQLFALLGEWSSVQQSKTASATHNSIRMGFALGWLVGPLAGGAIMRIASAPWLFAIVGAVGALAVLVGAVGLRDAPPCEAVTHDATASRRDSGALTWFLVALFLAFAADGAARAALLPIYVMSALGVSSLAFGLILTVGVVLELPALGIIGRLGDRFGLEPIIVSGLLAATSAFALIAFGKSLEAVIAAELIRVVYAAALLGSAMVHMQRLTPGRLGFGMALYTATFQLAPAVAAPLLGLASERLGWSVTFAMCAAMTLVAALIVARSARTRRT